MILITTEEIAVYVKKEIIRELFTNVKGFNHCGVIDLWISGKTLDRYISKVSQYFLNETKEQLAEVYNNGLKNGHTLFIRKSEYEKILNNYLSEKYNVEQKCLEMVSFKNSSLKQKKEIQLDYISKLEWTKTIKAEYMLYDAMDKEKNTYKVYNDTGTKRKYPFKYNKMNIKLSDLDYTINELIECIERTYPIVSKKTSSKERKKKRKENKAERVVYEQPEEGSGKKEKKKGPGIRVPKHTGLAVTAVVIVLAAAVLSFDSFYTLSEEEMAVVTTFGKPAVEEASGLHFKIPVIQRVTKVSKAITGMQIGYTTDPARADGASIDNPVSIENESLMITKDFNLTNVDFYVEYMVTDPVQAVRHRSVYESIIKNLAQSYIRDTVGVYNVDDVITTGKTQIQERIKEQLTNRLVEENIGYGIYNVSIQDTEMPRDDVANAFKAVEDAKQGMETAINSAKKYQSENIPEAKAKADKLLQDAEAYKEQRINEANGQVARFEDTYAEYVKYPLITKKRMFYETMEEVLPDLKVIITGGNGTQTLLPLEPFSETASGSAAQTGGGN